MIKISSIYHHVMWRSRTSTFGTGTSSPVLGSHISCTILTSITSSFRGHHLLIVVGLNHLDVVDHFVGHGLGQDSADSRLYRVYINIVVNIRRDIHGVTDDVAVVVQAAGSGGHFFGRPFDNTRYHGRGWCWRRRRACWSRHGHYAGAGAAAGGYHSISRADLKWTRQLITEVSNFVVIVDCYCCCCYTVASIWQVLYRGFLVFSRLDGRKIRPWRGGPPLSRSLSQYEHSQPVVASTPSTIHWLLLFLSPALPTTTCRWCLRRRPSFSMSWLYSGKPERFFTGLFWLEIT